MPFSCRIYLAISTANSRPTSNKQIDDPVRQIPSSIRKSRYIAPIDTGEGAMNRTTSVASLLLVALVSAVAKASDINMNPGLWQWTAVLDLPGMPLPLPPTSYTTCISRADFIPKDSQLGRACETIDLKTEGDKVSWNISCSQAAGVTHSKGSITYYGDSAEGTILLDVDGMQLSSTTKGKRLGPCR
ncbi:MAG: hypothetical protein B6D74_17765 [gamma proteobacterium symbiont of Ctena orbiculata]|nr:MAG: hypothetical protein B6D82_13415 [gamma proteobacterium symbiont of Ctena orbiculata]PVV17664.1 MAG: hypothetical protein B6D74_17765 [gamma proteobacterium symbiont of Ctena orbiculata]